MSWARLDIRQKIILSQSKIIVRWDNLKLFRRELMQWPASTIYNGVFTVWQSSLVTRQLNGKTNLLLHCYFLFPPFLGKKTKHFWSTYFEFVLESFEEAFFAFSLLVYVPLPIILLQLGRANNQVELGHGDDPWVTVRPVERDLESDLSNEA